MADSTDNLRVLNDVLTSTLILLVQFSTSLTQVTATPSPAERIDNPPDPLHILADAAKLVKAHTTKLSLLAINKPFTPSAITKVLQELTATCLPAMVSAVQICENEKATSGALMGKEVQSRVRRVFKELETLLGEVKSIAAGKTVPGRRDTLGSTGVVWESCDALVELEKLGLGGLALQKAQQYQETIKDALVELQEWKEGEDLDFEGHSDKLADSDDEGVDGDRNTLDDIFNAQNSMPKDRPELEALVDEAAGKLKKVVILYQAMAKRRIKGFDISKMDGKDKRKAVSQLDELVVLLRKLPHQVDDMIGKFYELDEDAARTALGSIINNAKAACEQMDHNWTGAEDEFSLWLKKWIAAVD